MTACFPLICPVCGNNLIEEEKRFVCSDGHSYDKARQGYVNLLLSNKQGVHGDDKLMVKARREFLDKGYYSPMREAVGKIVGEGNIVLDAGCGEGYYTSVFAEKNTVCGIDVSKDAVKSASGRCKNVTFAVASVYELPVANESVDVAVNIFSPDSRAEYLRVLKKGGRLITVTPMGNHLMELKEAVYDNPYKNAYVDPARDGFKLVSTKEIKYSVELKCQGDIMSLFSMTPYYYNTSQSDRNKLNSIENMTVGLEFLICEYTKE